jgi:hypothetical protein
MLGDRPAARCGAAAAAAAAGSATGPSSSRVVCTGPPAATAAGAAECCKLPHLDCVDVVDLCSHVVGGDFVVAVYPVGTAATRRVCRSSTSRRTWRGRGATHGIRDATGACCMPAVASHVTAAASAAAAQRSACCWRHLSPKHRTVSRCSTMQHVQRNTHQNSSMPWCRLSCLG